LDEVDGDHESGSVDERAYSPSLSSDWAERMAPEVSVRALHVVPAVADRRVDPALQRAIEAAVGRT
jgi:hypothetical protein